MNIETADDESEPRVMKKQRIGVSHVSRNSKESERNNCFKHSPTQDKTPSFEMQGVYYIISIESGWGSPRAAF